MTRIPEERDLVTLAREFDRLGVAYLVIGGFAINRLGHVRATDDLDLLIARDRANQQLVMQALEILPDKVVRELGDEDLAQWVVVRVNDDIPIDLMGGECFDRDATPQEAAEVEMPELGQLPLWLEPARR